MKRNFSFHRITDEEKIDDMQFSDDYSEQFFDFIVTKKCDFSDKSYILLDSFYGVSFDYDYVFYLYSPLLEIEYDFENIFQFLKLGGKYVVIGETVYYYYPEFNG